MRTWEFTARIGLCVISAVWTLSCGSVTGQDILPSNRFNVADGDWDAGASWSETRVPTTDEIVAINSGTARVSSSVGNVTTLGVRGGGILSVETGGSLTVEDQAIIGPGGTLRYSGGSLSAENLVFTGNISLDAAVAGDVSFGDSWEVATSANIAGTPANISLDGGTLDRGLALRYSATDTGAMVMASNEPILVIDRATGNASIENAIGGGLDLKGYTITGNTIGEGWNSLADQGTSGWAEANVTETRFTEYSLTGSETIAVGGSVAVGQLLDTFLPPTGEDVAFEYILGDGTVSAGPVEYVGPINDLVLQIDPETGAASISHQAAPLPELDVIGYTISSASGSLNVGEFSGIGETGWSITNPQGNALTEVNLEGSKMFSFGTDASLGNIFGGEQDLVFQYATSDNQILTGTVSYEVPDVVVGCEPLNGLLGDLDGNGSVEFADFLTLSGNFGTMVSTYEEGDIDCNGSVEFADFLSLSGNFGQSLAGAQSVPEPTGGLLAVIGLLGGMMFRRNRKVLLCGLAVAAAATTIAPEAAVAQGLDARFIRLHPDSPNAGINSIVEAQGILDGSVIDVIINEDITGSYEIFDLAGGNGTFSSDQQPYLNGVSDDSMNNFLTYLTGEITLPAGDYMIGCGSDDGCMINIPGITFIETFNENGPVVDGDGQIIFNPGRGHAWTLGTFTVPTGGVTSPIAALSNEGGGGDSFEIAIVDFIPEEGTDDEFLTGDRNNWIANNMFILEDGGLVGLELSPGPFTPVATIDGDFNGDGEVTSADADILQANMFSGGGVGAGDITGNGFVDFDDLAAFTPIFEAANSAGAQSVPEPSTSALTLVGALALFSLRRKR